MKFYQNSHIFDVFSIDQKLVFCVFRGQKKSNQKNSFFYKKPHKICDLIKKILFKKIEFWLRTSHFKLLLFC